MNKIYLLSGLLVVLALILLAMILIGPSAQPLRETAPVGQRGDLSAQPPRESPAGGEPSDLSARSAATRSAVTVSSAETSRASGPRPGESRSESVPGPPESKEDPATAALASEEERERKEQAIWDAAYTFSPAGLKVLAPFLNDPDPAVREAAIEGIEQLASPEGIAVLRSAVPRARSEEERRRLLEAAEWLALPEWQGSR